MPVRDIGGITRANLAGVLHLTRQGERLLVGCNVNSRIPKARIAIANGRQTIFSESVDLSPEHVWQKRIDHAAAAAHYTMTIADANGNVLLRQKEGEFDWTPASEVHIGPQTGYQFPPPSERTEGDWLQVGTVQEQNGGVLNVIDSYGQALRLFPHSYALLKAHGRAAASFGRFEEAEHSLAAAAKRDTVDPEVHYYLGISEEALGKLREARLSFEAAYRFPEFRAAAALRLGEMMARNGDADLASRYLREAAKLLPDDQRATEEWLLFRPPTSEVRNALVRFPLSDALREALGSPDLAALAGDADRVIEVAILYMRLGHYQNAAKVLSRAYPAIPEAQHEPGSVLPQDHALVRYLRAYCNLKLGKDDVAMEFRKASDASLLYIFPNRPEVLPALQEALRINSSDASAEFLIGTYLFQLGEIDAGISHWQRARQLRPAIPALHADIGNALLHVNQDFDGALAAFEEGTRFDPDNAALYTGMEQALSLLHRPPADRVHDLERYPLNREMPANLAFELALNRSETGDIERAEALFRGRFFPRREGGTNVRQVWLEVELQKSLQLAQKHDCPSAIGAADALAKPVAGLDFTNDGLDAFLRPARTQFLLGVVHEQCHDDTNARTHFEKASAQLDPAQIFWAYRASQKLASDTMAWPAALSGALEQAQKNERTSSNPGWWIYNQALLKMALGDSEHAKTDFGRALLAPDNALSYHLVRLAESGVIPE
jgi:Flp pilus assembly protein TadD